MWTKPVVASVAVRIGIVIAIALAALNLVWLVAEYGRLYSSINAGIAQGGSAPLLNHSVIRRDLTIEIALIVAAIGALSRKVGGLLFTLIALVWVFIEYIGWYIWTKQTIVAAGLTDLPSGVPQAWKLVGATPWNLVILVVAVFLFLWEVRVVRESFRANNTC